MDTVLDHTQPIKGKTKGTGLRFIPVQDFSLVPMYLIAQIKPRLFKPERLYKLSPAICGNPLNLLGVFAPMDPGAPAHGQVKGFLWATINPLDERIHVHMLSVDKAYQGRGIVEETKNILEKIRTKHELKGMVFRTTRPKAFEKLGFRRSETLLMEV